MTRKPLSFLVGCALLFTLAVSAGAQPVGTSDSEPSFWSEVWDALMEVVETTLGTDEEPTVNGQDVAPEEPDDPGYGPDIDHLG